MKTNIILMNGNGATPDIMMENMSIAPNIGETFKHELNGLQVEGCVYKVSHFFLPDNHFVRVYYKQIF